MVQGNAVCKDYNLTRSCGDGRMTVERQRYGSQGNRPVARFDRTYRILTRSLRVDGNPSHTLYFGDTLFTPLSWKDTDDHSAHWSESETIYSVSLKYKLRV